MTEWDYFPTAAEPSAYSYAETKHLQGAGRGPQGAAFEHHGEPACGADSVREAGGARAFGVVPPVSLSREVDRLLMSRRSPTEREVSSKGSILT